MFWKNKPKLLIIDGRNLLWRNADAFSNLFVVKKDHHIATGGIYGFFSNLIKIHQRYGGKVVVAWEGKNNFRYKLYPGYKKRDANQEYLDLVEEINEQQTRIQSMLRLMGVEQYTGYGCEGDDILATLADKWTESGQKQAIIYTGDSDLRQCVTVYTFVVSPQRKAKEIVYGIEQVVEKDGVYPRFIPDLKAMTGDTSDKFPGVKSVGKVTAVKLINEYGTLKKIVKAAKKNLDTWPCSEKNRLAFLKEKKDAKLYKKIATVLKDAEIKRIKTKKNQKVLIKHLKYYKFLSLMAPNELFELMNMGKKQ